MCGFRDAFLTHSVEECGITVDPSAEVSGSEFLDAGDVFTVDVNYLAAAGTDEMIMLADIGIEMDRSVSDFNGRCPS